MKKNKIVMILASLIIGFSLWAYVITEVDTQWEDTYSNIPVNLDGIGLLEERGLMLMPGGDTTVTLRLAGKRTDLIKLTPGNITLRADLSGITAPGEYTLTYDVIYPGDVPSGSVSVQSRTPAMARVVVAQRVSREVPVEVNYEGSVPSDFITDKENATLDYSTIRVSGPEEVVEKIHHAAITVDLTNRTESILDSYRYVLCDASDEPVDVELVTTNVAEVQLQVKIQRLKTVPLTLTVLNGGGATVETSKITVSPETIQISGSDTALESLQEINLGTVDLGEITKDTQQIFEIVLPESITNLTGVDKATVDISFPDLRTRTFQISDITAIHVPQGLEALLLTEQLAVTVRGPKNVVAAMSASDVKVTVDFTDAAVGTSSWKAHVAVTTKGVGAVGSYSVSVTVQEKKTEPVDAE